jgi:antitoxin (DNA-binding transcriptional repressor) of toxin-antitoxin stability system
MKRVNVAEAKAQLSRLIDAALEGEEVVIARRNKALVKLTVVKEPKAGAGFGMLTGRIRLSADFDAPLDDFEAYAPARAKRKRTR